MIYLLYGDNDYLIDQRVAELKRQFGRKYNPDDIATIDVDETAAVDIMGRLTGISLFSPHQMIIVPTVTASTEVWTMLETNVDQIPADNVVVLAHIKTLSRVNSLSITRTFKKLKSAGASLEKFEALKPWNVKSWLADEIKRRHLAMDGRAQAELLRLTAGEDNQQARLTIELNKLALLKQPLTAELIQQYVEPSLETNAFAILGAALAGRHQQVVKLLRQLQSAGEDYNRFLGLLASQELALAVAISGADIKVNSYQLRQAQEMASELGSIASQQAKLRRLAEMLAVLDGRVKQAKPDEAWLLIEAALSRL